jgi:creatinine amidohydrolase
MAYPGTITLRADTLVQLCMDIGESLIYHGFKKLVFINGNRAANLPPMETAASKLRFLTGAFVAVADAGLLAKSAVYDVCDGPEGGLGHAGESETAYTLYRNPELVDMALAVDAERHQGRFGFSHKPMEPPFDGDSVYVPRTDADMRRTTEATQGIAGSATLATREKGERIHAILSDALVEFIETHVRPVKVELKDVQIPV